MLECKYKTGDFVTEIITPHRQNQGEPYNRFICGDEKADVTAVFQYVNTLPEKKGRLLAKNSACSVYENEDRYLFFYNTVYSSDVYAVKILKKDCFCKWEILFSEEYREKLWQRVVFSVIGFEDIAAFCGHCVFHGSYADIGGEALLFTGPCGIGKSTQAAVWEKHENAEIINGDKILLSFKDGRLFAHGLPFSGSSGICKNRSLPVKAIVSLDKAKKNIIYPMKGLKAYKAVTEGIYHSLWSGELNEKLSGFALKICESVKIYKLCCLPDASAAELLKRELEK